MAKKIQVTTTNNIIIANLKAAARQGYLAGYRAGINATEEEREDFKDNDMVEETESGLNLGTVNTSNLLRKHLTDHEDVYDGIAEYIFQNTLYSRN